MKEHLQDLKSGGRPMTKLELANKEIERLKKYEKFIYNIIITPVDFNDENGNYQLHNYSKQDLYKKLFLLRHEIIHEKYDK